MRSASAGGVGKSCGATITCTPAFKADCISSILARVSVVALTGSGAVSAAGVCVGEGSVK